MMSSPFKLLLIMFISFIINHHAVAVDINELNTISKIKIESDLFSNPVEFNVTLPYSYKEQPDKRYILLLDFHPRSQIYLSGLHDWLSHNGGNPWLETLVVTPVRNNQLWKVINSINSEKGGAALLDFIEYDLLPIIEKNYRTNSFRILNGFTYNASLSLYTLFNRPDLFNAYIAVSPQLSDDYAKLILEAEGSLKKLTDKPRYLFLSTGSSDNDTFKRLNETIKLYAPKQLRWQIQYFTNFSYMSQPVLAITYAIDDIFSDIHNDLKPDSEISRKGTEAIIEYYEYLSKEKYGFNVSAEKSLIALGVSMLKEEPEKALNILNLVVKTFPNSANAYHFLAKAHADMGQFEKAVKYQKQANERAQSLIRWYKELHKRYLEEYQLALIQKQNKP